MPLSLANVVTAAALTAGLGRSTAPDLALDLAGHASGAWGWPLAGTPVVARPFQPPTTRWGPGHRGVDLVGLPQEQVLAAGAGVVSFAGYVAGVGVVAILHPRGLRTTYEPVSPSVSAGRAVTLGMPVGRLLSGHGDCGPGHWCLHWGLLRGSTYLDPLTLVGRGPVRLLPLTGQAAGVMALAARPAAADDDGSAAALASAPRNRPALGTEIAPGRATATGSGGSEPRRRSVLATVIGRAAGAGGVTALAVLARQARRRRMAGHRGRHRGSFRVRTIGPG